MRFNALVIGSSSSIAKAITEQFIQQENCQRIFTVSRQPSSFNSQKITPFLTDYSEASIAQICNSLTKLSENLTHVIVCNGILHNSQFMPEKKLADINQEQLSQVYHVNAIIPVLWLSHLAPLLESGHTIKIAVFSARIGSISDNRMGGWYSYRASKAALNMLLQTSAIEYARRAPNVKLIAFHPGTTDTPLSKPFQRSVAKEKLFTPDFVAERLLSIMESTPADQTVSYLDWDNQPISW